MNNAVKSTQGLIANKKFRITRKIGSGSFGEIWSGISLVSGEPVAVKLEAINWKSPHLVYECKVYKGLRGVIGFPRIRYYGVEGDYNVMIIDLLGPCLEDLFRFCRRQFSIQTVCLLGIQMVQRLESCHTRGWLHRDVKPHNFCMGRNEEGRRVYLVDFGLAKAFRDPGNGEHIKYRDGKSLIGTVRYVSLHTHIGVEQARRDDVESLGYVLIYFARGYLPWQGMTPPNQNSKGIGPPKSDAIFDKKAATSPRSLCERLPRQFEIFITYCRSLAFMDQPDYKLLRRLLMQVIFEKGLVYERKFDWMIEEREELEETQKKDRNGVGLGGRTLCSLFVETQVIVLFPVHIKEKSMKRGRRETRCSDREIKSLVLFAVLGLSRYGKLKEKVKKKINGKPPTGKWGSTKLDKVDLRSPAAFHNKVKEAAKKHVAEEVREVRDAEEVRDFEDADIEKIDVDEQVDREKRAKKYAKKLLKSYAVDPDSKLLRASRTAVATTGGIDYTVTPLWRLGNFVLTDILNSAVYNIKRSQVFPEAFIPREQMYDDCTRMPSGDLSICREHVQNVEIYGKVLLDQIMRNELVAKRNPHYKAMTSAMDDQLAFMAGLWRDGKNKTIQVLTKLKDLVYKARYFGSEGMMIKGMLSDFPSDPTKYKELFPEFMDAVNQFRHPALNPYIAGRYSSGMSAIQFEMAVVAWAMVWFREYCKNAKGKVTFQSLQSNYELGPAKDFNFSYGGHKTTAAQASADSQAAVDLFRTFGPSDFGELHGVTSGPCVVGLWNQPSINFGQPYGSSVLDMMQPSSVGTYFVLDPEVQPLIDCLIYAKPDDLNVVLAGRVPGIKSIYPFVDYNVADFYESGLEGKKGKMARKAGLMYDGWKNQNTSFMSNLFKGGIETLQKHPAKPLTIADINTITGFYLIGGLNWNHAPDAYIKGQSSMIDTGRRLMNLMGQNKPNAADEEEKKAPKRLKGYHRSWMSNSKHMSPPLAHHVRPMTEITGEVGIESAGFATGAPFMNNGVNFYPYTSASPWILQSLICNMATASAIKKRGRGKGKPDSAKLDIGNVPYIVNLNGSVAPNILALSGREFSNFDLKEFRRRSIQCSVLPSVSNGFLTLPWWVWRSWARLSGIGGPRRLQSHSKDVEVVEVVSNQNDDEVLEKQEDEFVGCLAGSANDVSIENMSDNITETDQSKVDFKKKIISYPLRLKKLLNSELTKFFEPEANAQRRRRQTEIKYSRVTDNSVPEALPAALNKTTAMGCYFAATREKMRKYGDRGSSESMSKWISERLKGSDIGDIYDLFITKFLDRVKLEDDRIVIEGDPYLEPIIKKEEFAQFERRMADGDESQKNEDVDEDVVSTKLESGEEEGKKEVSVLKFMTMREAWSKSDCIPKPGAVPTIPDGQQWINECKLLPCVTPRFPGKLSNHSAYVAALQLLNSERHDTCVRPPSSLKPFTLAIDEASNGLDPMKDLVRLLSETSSARKFAKTLHGLFVGLATVYSTFLEWGSRLDYGKKEIVLAEAPKLQEPPRVDKCWNYKWPTSENKTAASPAAAVQEVQEDSVLPTPAAQYVMRLMASDLGEICHRLAKAMPNHSDRSMILYSTMVRNERALLVDLAANQVDFESKCQYERLRLSWLRDDLITTRFILNNGNKSYLGLSHFRWTLLPSTDIISTHSVAWERGKLVTTPTTKEDKLVHLKSFEWKKTTNEEDMRELLLKGKFFPVV